VLEQPVIGVVEAVIVTNGDRVLGLLIEFVKPGEQPAPAARIALRRRSG